jgi:alpha-L-rhamnosidase
VASFTQLCRGSFCCGINKALLNCLGQFIALMSLTTLFAQGVKASTHVWVDFSKSVFEMQKPIQNNFQNKSDRYQKSGTIWVDGLSCAQKKAPINLDMTKPELGWQIKAGEQLKNVWQTAYQIQVASNKNNLLAGNADLWESKKVLSDQQLHINYEGKALRSFQKVYWRVRVWTTEGRSDWSPVASWRMGMLLPSDRKGRWIGWDQPFLWDSVRKFPVLSARYLRKEFTETKGVKSAVAYISGLGLYELHINGKKAGDAVLAPAPTDYTKTVLYNAIDVTSLLKQGQNAIGVVLGSGRFFAMRQDYKPWKWRNFGFPKLYFQLRIEYTDGTVSSVVSDDSWHLSAMGPIRNNNEYDGERYDARMELTGWDEPGYIMQKDVWRPVQLVTAPTGKWTAQLNPLMKVMQQIKPIAVLAAADGGFILDMGQNMAGWIHMDLNGLGHRGDTVTLRFAESLTKTAGGIAQLYTANLRDARATDTYIIKGAEKEDWRPHFTYHGFRYVEVQGFPNTKGASPENNIQKLLGSFTGEVVYDNLDNTGWFSCSDATINQIYKNAVWGIKSNYKGMPVDCPQRNERQPWLGDRTTGAYGESFAFNNQLLYDKWMSDIQDAQLVTGCIPDVAPNFWLYYKDDVTWPSTFLSVTDMLYRQYGDLAAIRKHYSSMKFWIEYMHHKYVKGGLIDKDSYGDWCVPPDSLHVIHSSNPAKITAGGLIATATFYHDLELMSKFALLIGAGKDTGFFRPITREMKTAFQQRYFKADSGYYGNNTVTANLLPLAFGLTSKADIPRVFSHIVNKTHLVYDDHISTGVIGIQWLLRILSRYGRNDLAVKIASQRTYPSWGYMAANGATTIWELWNGNTADPAMNSQNHVMLLGDLLIWLFENQAGIKSDPLQTGFKKIVLAPQIKGGLQYVKASYLSDYGAIKSEWHKSKNRDQWTWQVSIPAGTKAVLKFPKGVEKVSQDGRPLEGAGQNGEDLQLKIGSGTYYFQGRLMAGMANSADTK